MVLNSHLPIFGGDQRHLPTSGVKTIVQMNWTFSGWVANVFKNLHCIGRCAGEIPGYLLGEFWVCRVSITGIETKKVKAEQKKGSNDTNSAIVVVTQQLYLSQGTDGLEL